MSGAGRLLVTRAGLPRKISEQLHGKGLQALTNQHSSCSWSTINLRTNRQIVQNQITAAACVLRARSRKFSTSHNLEDESVNATFTKIYFLPQITVLRMLSRLKIYQTGITLLVLPATGYLAAVGTVPFSVFQYSASLAMFAGAMLYVMSGFFRRVIGMIAIDETQTVLRVSHMTFWGKRRDRYINVGEVVPLSETPDNVRDVYVHFRTYTNNDVLYLSLKCGHILDWSLLEKVLGDVTLHDIDDE